MDWTQYVLSMWTQPFLQQSQHGPEVSCGRMKHQLPVLVMQHDATMPRPNLMNTVVFLVETAGCTADFSGCS